jgi:hypothetical protein
MHHIGTITKTANKSLPFHAQCSCGPAGDFSTKESAEAFLRSHLAKQGGISTQELVDDSEKVVEETPIPPLTHAASPASVTDEPPAQGEGPVQGESPVTPPPESEENWPKKKKK